MTTPLGASTPRQQIDLTYSTLLDSPSKLPPSSIYSTPSKQWGSGKSSLQTTPEKQWPDPLSTSMRTPTPVRLVLEETSHHGLHSETPRILRAVESISGMSKTPTSAEKSVDCARRVHQRIVSPNQPSSVRGLVEKHAHAMDLMRDNPRLAKARRELERIEKTGDPFSPPSCTVPVQYTHLIAPDKNGTGWHLLGQNEENIPLVNLLVSTSGVVYAGFANPKGIKYSTFFPPKQFPSLIELDRLIQNNRHFQLSGNRGLCYSPEYNIYFEVYYQNWCINTAFPIFFVGNYQKAQVYSIIEGKPSIASSEVLTAACTLVQEYSTPCIISADGNPIRYCVEEANEIGEAEIYLYIDISRWLSEHYAKSFPIELRGVFFRMPKSLFVDIKNIDAISEEP